MEFRIASRVVHSHDFLEGVRAVPIDKNERPAWRPQELVGVTNGSLNALFTSRGEDELTFEWES